MTIQRVGTLVGKRTQNIVRWRASSFVSGFLHSSPAKPPVRRLKGLAWLASRWGLQKCCRNRYSRNQAPHLESWRTQVYYASGPRGVNTPSSELQNKGGLQFSYRHVVTQEGKSRQLRRVLECRNGKTRPFSSFPPLINGWNCITCLPSYPLGRRYLPYSSAHAA